MKKVWAPAFGWTEYPGRSRVVAVLMRSMSLVVFLAVSGSALAQSTVVAPAAPPTVAGQRPTTTEKRLVVVVPGLGLTPAKWDPLISRLKRDPEYSDRQTDWLLFDHAIHSYTFGSLEEAADELRGRIHERWLAAKGYDEIVLAGHSMGGLIVRQAYLAAAGAMPEAPVAAPWISKVTRIVLFATPNSGTTKYQELNRLSQGLMSRLGRHFAVSDLYRGSDFITNLRINWIRYFASLTKPPPTVIHFRGVRDQTVRKQDSEDVLAFPNAGFTEVPEADHDTILDISSDERYALLRNGFVGRAESPASASPGPERVVFILHGIRASNVDAWVRAVKAEVNRQDPKAIVVEPGYPYFSAADFARPAQRRKSIPWFQERYAEILAQHRKAEFHFIGHSNGTYILGHSLEHIKGMRFKNVVLAGSVLPVDYPWGRRIADGQVGRVRNDRADSDVPVGLLCSGLRGLFMRDIGTGGFAGFSGWQTSEVAYFPGGHSAALALNGSNVADIVTFALGGDPVRPSGLSSDPGVFRNLSRLMPYLTFLLLLCVLAWWLVWPLWRTHRIRRRRLVIGASILIALYVFLDIL